MLLAVILPACKDIPPCITMPTTREEQNLQLEFLKIHSPDVAVYSANTVFWRLTSAYTNVISNMYYFKQCCWQIMRESQGAVL